MAALTLLAQAAGGMSIIQMIVIAIVIMGAVGIAIIVARASGIAIPTWFWSILGIVFLIVVAVLAVRFIGTL